MDGFSLVDIYSTKGIEYMVAVVFFFGFLALQWYMLRPEPGNTESAPPTQGRLLGQVPRAGRLQLPSRTHLDEGGADG